MVESIVNFLIEAAAKVGEGFVWLLPTFSVGNIVTDLIPRDILRIVSYVIPVSQIIDIGTMWLTAVGLWYLYQIILRWVRAIQ
jgi:hypothetical protein